MAAKSRGHGQRSESSHAASRSSSGHTSPGRSHCKTAEGASSLAHALLLHDRPGAFPEPHCLFCVPKAPWRLATCPVAWDSSAATEQGTTLGKEDTSHIHPATPIIALPGSDSQPELQGRCRRNSDPRVRLCVTPSGAGVAEARGRGSRKQSTRTGQSGLEAAPVGTQGHFQGSCARTGAESCAVGGPGVSVTAAHVA